MTDAAATSQPILIVEDSEEDYEAIRRLKEFWFEIALLPKNGDK